jgi:ribosomal protein S18 acetylase RimI-like enzyme
MMEKIGAAQGVYDAAVLLAHRERMRSLDVLLPESGPLPEPGDGDAILRTEGGLGLARRRLVDADSLSAVWMALDQRWLGALVASPAAMNVLLGRWREHLANGAPPAGDCAGIVVWPSRDVVMTPVFLDHGLVPDSVIAVRPSGRSTPVNDAAAEATVRVRRAGPHDLAAIVALCLEEVRYAAQLSGTPQRPNTAALLRERSVAALAETEPLVWVAEQDGDVTGLISVVVREQAAWIAPLVSAAPVAYVDCAAVAPGRRGRGVAASIVRHVHDAMDAAGIAVTALHYGALNPLSGPLWHRSGYRPLRTRWTLRIAHP